MTNKEFAKENHQFKRACDQIIIGKKYDEQLKDFVSASLPNTPRQASKFRNGKGLAYKTWAGMKGEN